IVAVGGSGVGLVAGTVVVVGGDGQLFVLLAQQVGLVQDDEVGEGDLLDGLVLDILRLLLVQMLLHVCRVDDCHDAVQTVLLLHLVIDEKGLRHGGGVGHTGSLDQDGVEGRQLLAHALEGLDEVAADRAADAAVH
ncbi:unnamed protein product, partial [Ectocarpus sp. 4 AP-2014]